MRPGMLVFGSGEPLRMTRPSVCPRIVSIAAWQSRPAQKPGPTPMTTGASLILVPRFRFARIASTSASGRSQRRHAPSGSGRTGIFPAESAVRTSASVSQRTAVTSMLPS